MCVGSYLYEREQVAPITHSVYVWEHSTEERKNGERGVDPLHFRSMGPSLHTSLHIESIMGARYFLTVFVHLVLDVNLFTPCSF